MIIRKNKKREKVAYFWINILLGILFVILGFFQEIKIENGTFWTIWGLALMFLFNAWQINLD